MTPEPTPTMSFASLLKGRLAERIVVSLLERGGFRVTRLGIEELFDEVKYLPREKCLSLGLPAQLRALPDLLVADPGVAWAAMIEIKYRRKFDETTARELRATLGEQRRYWPDAWALVMIAEPFIEGGRFHQDYIRLIGRDDLDKLVDPIEVRGFSDDSDVSRMRWERLPMLTKLFYSAHADDDHGLKLAQQFWQGADFVTTAIRELRNL